MMDDVVPEMPEITNHVALTEATSTPSALANSGRVRLSAGEDRCYPSVSQPLLKPAIVIRSGAEVA